MDPFELELERIKARQDLMRYSYAESKANIAETNQTERDLCGQLILLGTVVLTATGALIASNWIKEPVTLGQVGALMGAVLSLIGAIAAWVRYYFVIINFQIEWATANHAVGKLYSKEYDPFDPAQFNPIRAAANKILDAVPTETNSTMLKAGIYLLITAAAFYVILLSAFLVNFHIPYDLIMSITQLTPQFF